MGLASKSCPLTAEFKRLLGEQHQRIAVKHQQDLDLIDDIRAYTKARLSIERDYTSALSKLAKQHSAHINKKFTLLDQNELLSPALLSGNNDNGQPNPTSNCDSATNNPKTATQLKQQASSLDNAAAVDAASDSKLQKRLANTQNSSGYAIEEPQKASSLYGVWAEHIRRLAVSSKNRADQFEQLVIVVDKLKDIRGHKATLGKKSLDNHLKRIHEDLLGTMIDLDKAKKLYYEDESQAKKARENEEKIRKKRSGLLTKFTDLQAKKEKTSAQREANDIQSTQARNDYIMALAAANAHLRQYYFRDLKELIGIIDDGVLGHCKVFMATLSECDINSLKDSLTHAQYWSKMINLTGSQTTNSIFLESQQSNCLWRRDSLPFEACNQDPIQCISLEHNADYALQHEIDKWFTWFKKECRNLSQLMHQLETCQQAAAEGKKTIELNGQGGEVDLENKIIELKQLIRKSEAAKLKAQARLRVIKEGGMQIEEWGAVEQEIKADMARAQEAEREARQSKAPLTTTSSHENSMEQQQQQQQMSLDQSQQSNEQQLHVSEDSDERDFNSMNNLASSLTPSQIQSQTSNKQQETNNMGSHYTSDPWQDDPTGGAWGSSTNGYNVVVTDAYANALNSDEPIDNNMDPDQVFGNHHHDGFDDQQQDLNNNNSTRYDLLSASANKHHVHHSRSSPNQGSPRSPQLAHNINKQQTTSMTVQSSSPLSAIVDGGCQRSPSPYGAAAVGEAYKSDYECDYNRSGHGPLAASSAGSDPFNGHHRGSTDDQGMNHDYYKDHSNSQEAELDGEQHQSQNGDAGQQESRDDVMAMLNRRVIALYPFQGSNEDDLAMEEGDILRVVELNDYDWARAVNETTQELGFIPTSYVRLLNDNEEDQDQAQDHEQEQSTTVAGDDDEGEQQSVTANTTTPAKFSDFEGAEAEPEAEQSHQWSEISKDHSEFQEHQFHSETNQEEEEAPAQLCRALYDYEPENESVEEDGLPHLRLTQGELLRIIEADENDGWWLVERESNGERGHVHSILVEEVDPNAPEEEANDENQDQNDEPPSEASECRGAESIKDMPTFAPPPLAADFELEEEVNNEAPDQLVEASQQIPQIDVIENSEAKPHQDQIAESAPQLELRLPPEEEDLKQSPQTDRKESERPARERGPELRDNDADKCVTTSLSITSSSQLMPTSFIIIEPTPEIESRSLQDFVTAKEREQKERDDLEEEERLKRDCELQQQAAADEVRGMSKRNRQVIRSSESSQAPSDVCYSVVSEDFAFDELTRKPDEQVRRRLEHDYGSVGKDHGDQESSVSDVEGYITSLKEISEVDPYYRDKAENFSRDIINEAIGLAYGQQK